MKKQLYLSQLKPVLQLCYKHKGYFILSVILDLVLLLILGFFQFWTMLNVRDYVVQLGEIVQADLQAMALTNGTLANPADIFGSPEMMGLYHVVLKYFMLLVLFSLIAWMVFKLINWYIANKIVRKVKFLPFTLKFVLYTLLAFVFLFVIFVIMGRLTAYAMFSAAPLIGKTGANIITVLLVWLLAYFVFIAYALIPGVSCKKLLNFAVDNYRVIVPAHLFLLVLLIVVSYLTVWSFAVNYWAPLFCVLLVALPAITYGRIYIVVVVNKVLKRG